MMMVTSRCENLGPFDAIFLLDDEVNIANVLGTLYFEKFEFESMKNYLEAKTADIHKCRSKLVKKFGLWWYQEMGEKEWQEKKNSVFVLKEGIHN